MHVSFNIRKGDKGNNEKVIIPPSFVDSIMPTLKILV
jgi:hypothetical protein